VVAAAGNSNVDTSTFVPGGCASAVTVAAVDQNLKRATFSNFGTKVDVAAPGVGIYSSYIGGGYKSLNGTSMATPHIVGLASIARLYHPNMSGEEFKTLIKNTKSPIFTETNKPIANFVNVPELLSALTGKQAEKMDEKTPLEKKDEKSSEKEKQAPPTQTGSDDVGNNELKVVIDESIGLEIQNDSKMAINSV
jgi:subtilisin family serine protease